MFDPYIKNPTFQETDGLAHGGSGFPQQSKLDFSYDQNNNSAYARNCFKLQGTRDKTSELYVHGVSLEVSDTNQCPFRGV